MRRRLSAVVPYVVILALACGAPVARGESTSDEEVIKTQREAIEAKYDSLVVPILGAAGAKRLHDAIERIDSLADVGELARASAKT